MIRNFGFVLNQIFYFQFLDKLGGLLEVKGVIVFQNVLLSVILRVLTLEKIFFLNFLYNLLQKFSLLFVNFNVLITFVFEIFTFELRSFHNCFP